MTDAELTMLCDTLKEVCQEMDARARELDDKYKSLGDDKFNTKMMYANQAIGFYEASTIVYKWRTKLIEDYLRIRKKYKALSEKEHE